jgi:phytoene/squalene synthetase
MCAQRAHIDFLEDLDFSQILTNPILDIAARVWEEDRYEAFKVCYRSMRVVDDLVDNLKSGSRPADLTEARAVQGMIQDWIRSLRDRDSSEPFMAQLLDAVDCFRMPIWPWERLARAMIYDLTHDGFPTFVQFLRYTEGAAIAPAAVFMHLCGVSRINADRYTPPSFDVRVAARPLAVFSYLVHIMRDFQKDHGEGLNYFADNLLSLHRVSSRDLEQSAQTGNPTEPVRALLQTYRSIAEYYRLKARQVMERITPSLEDRYQLSWELIYELYNQIYQRVTPARPDFDLAAVQPEPPAVQACIRQTIADFRHGK